jgi:hypothetical protein
VGDEIGGKEEDAAEVHATSGAPVVSKGEGVGEGIGGMSRGAADGEWKAKINLSGSI